MLSAAAAAHAATHSQAFEFALRSPAGLTALQSISAEQTGQQPVALLCVLSLPTTRFLQGRAGMGDKSPKSTNKAAKQKKASGDRENKKKRDAQEAKRVVPGKK
jgi:hypothetical protein